MKPAVFFFRVAAALIFVFAAGHTLGFRNIDPGWGIAQTIAQMKSIHFLAQGFVRTYWDFYVGFGLSVSVLFFLTSVIVWNLGRNVSSHWVALRPISWSITLSFALIAILSWRYFFAVPLAFSILICMCLFTANLLASRAGAR